MNKPELMQAAALLDQANEKLMASFENDDMDEYDYEDVIPFASKLICKARELILASYDETKDDKR